MIVRVIRGSQESSPSGAMITRVWERFQKNAAAEPIRGLQGGWVGKDEAPARTGQGRRKGLLLSVQNLGSVPRWASALLLFSGLLGS